MDDRLQEIERLEEKADFVSFKLARYLRNTYPNYFYAKELEADFPLQNLRVPLPVNSPFANENFLFVTDPNGTRGILFSTFITDPPQIEVSLNVDKIPSLFQEFLQKMGLTYKAASDLYDFNFRTLQIDEKWI